MGTTFTCVATGDWDDDATWGLTDSDYPGKSGATDDVVIIDVANKSGGPGDLTVTLVADVELKAIKMAGTASGDATLHTASEHTLTLNDTEFSGYSAHVTGQTGFTGNVNFIFTKSGTTHIIIDPASQTNKLNDITYNHASLALHMLSNITIKGDLIGTAGTLSTQASGGGTSYALTVTGDCYVAGTLTGNASAISLGSLEVAASGTYNATTGTTTITDEDSVTGYTWDVNGTFNNNDGGVTFDLGSGVDSHIRTGQSDGANSFHNLTVLLNASTNTLTMRPNAGTVMTIEGNLTISEGVLQKNTHSHTLTVTGNVEIHAGGKIDATSASGAMNMGSLTIDAGGTYLATSGTTTITNKASSNFAFKNSGTFTHNSGTMQIGDGSTSTGGAHLMNNTYYNLTINREENAPDGNTPWRPSSGTEVTIAGDLTVTKGRFYRNNSSNSLVVTGDVDIAANGQVGTSAASGSNTFGSLTIASGGTYLATSGTTTITNKNSSNYIIQIAGLFTHNGGTVKIDTSVTGDKLLDLIPSSGVGLNNLIVNEDGSGVIQYNGNTTIAGDLTIEEGTLHGYDYNNSELTVTGGVTIEDGGTLGVTNQTGAYSFNSLTTENGGTFVASSGTTTILVDIRNRTGATFTHNGGTVLVTTGTTYFIHNTGTYSTITFNNLTYSGANCYLVKDIIVEGTFSNPSGYIRLTSGAKITLGTTTSQGTLAMGSNKLFPYATWYLYGASELYPGIVTGTNATPIKFSYGEGGANSANLKWLDIQFDINDVGGDDNYTITLDGSCEFDAVTIDADCTLDLNGQRMTTSGRLSGSGTFTGTNGLLSVADLRTDGFSSFDLQNTDIMFNASCSPRMNGSPSNKARTMFVQSGDVVGMARATTTVNNVIAAGDLRQGNNDQDMALADLTISVGGNLDTQTRTGISYTCSGDFTTSGGLIGLSALETVASSSESASTSANYTVLDNLASCTIEFWLKLTDISNTSARILNVNSGTSGEAYYIRTDGSALQFHLGCLTTDANFSNSDTSLLTLSNVGTKWHHYALVKDNNTVSLYIDGKKVAEKTTSGNTQSANSALVIGKYHGASSNYADMVMDELRFYTDVRTTSEIRDNMFTESPSGDALVGHYKFNEGTGTTVADSSSNSNTLTLSDAGAWAGAGTFTKGTSTIDMTGNGTINIAGGVTQFNNLKVAASGKTTTLAVLGGSSDIRFFGTLTHGGGTANSSGNPAWTMKGTATVSAGSDWSNWYLCYWESSTAVPAATWKYWLALTDSTLAGDMTCTGYFRPHQSVVDIGNHTLTTHEAIFHSTGGVNMGAGTITFANAAGLSSSQSDSVFTGGPGATVTGVAAKSTFMSQNNFAIVGKIENLDVTNEELKVTGQVINCTGDIHQYFPTIDHSQQLDADTADDRDVRLGRDLDKNTELINS
jgi:fibronectin-binding autotransporter adhesin